MLRRLFRREQPVGDLATGDWTPIPLSAVARPSDLVSWLSEEVATRPRPALDRLEERASWGNAGSAFTPEELAIIEEQRRAEAEAPLLKAAPPPEPLPEPPGAPAVEAKQPAGEGQRASWIDVLKAYAEHLTDAELRILRQQFQG